MASIWEYDIHLPSPGKTQAVSVTIVSYRTVVPYPKSLVLDVSQDSTILYFRRKYRVLLHKQDLEHHFVIKDGYFCSIVDYSILEFRPIIKNFFVLSLFLPLFYFLSCFWLLWTTIICLCREMRTFVHIIPFNPNQNPFKYVLLFPLYR